MNSHLPNHEKLKMIVVAKEPETIGGDFTTKIKFWCSGNGTAQWA